jgi:hypothetical protein
MFPTPRQRAHSRCSRLPRADVDPIASSFDALSLISLAMRRPLEFETIAFLLDDQRCGSTIAVISETVEPDMVIGVTESLCTVAASVPHLQSLVLASIRPDSATIPGDIDRWLEASAMAESFGIELVEWFVIGPSGPECPRDLLGEPERW